MDPFGDPIAVGDDLRNITCDFSLLAPNETKCNFISTVPDCFSSR